MAPPNALFSTFSFIGFLFCAIPLYWHLKGNLRPTPAVLSVFHKLTLLALAASPFPPVSNVGTSLYMVWAGLGCLNAFINSVVWNRSVANVAPVWCDICTLRPSLVLPEFADCIVLSLLNQIATRFIVGAAVGIPAALLVISYRLYKIQMRSVTGRLATEPEKRPSRDICIDLAIGLGIPILQMVLRVFLPDHLASSVSD